MSDSGARAEQAELERDRWKERWKATVAERDDLLTVLSDHPGHRMGCEWCENNDAAISRIASLVKEWSGWAHDDTLLAQTVVRSLRHALGGAA